MNSSPSSKRKFDLEERLPLVRCAVFLLGWVIALLAVFALWGAQGLVAQTNDLYRFAELGSNIADGEGLRLDGAPPTIRRAPMYPALIALLFTLFGEHQVVIQLVQSLMAAGTCLLVFEIGRRVFSARVGLIAAVFTAFHPMVMRYVPDIQVENFLTFLYTLTVYRTVRLYEEGTLLNGFFLGLAAAMTAMVKGVALPYVALFIVVYLYVRYKRRAPTDPMLPGLKQVAALLFAMGLVILPWTYRNYRVTGGKFVLISGNASGEFLRGYVFAQARYYTLKDRAYHDGENEADEMQRELFRKRGLVREADEAETEMVYNEAAKEKLRSDPLAFVKKCVIAFFMFWYVVTTVKNSLLVGGLALGAWVLTAIGWWRSRGAGYDYWLLIVPIVSLNLIYAAILALGRYSAPCIPTLMVLAAVGVDVLLPARAKALFGPVRAPDEARST